MMLTDWLPRLFHEDESSEVVTHRAARHFPYTPQFHMRIQNI